jgi:hypothetical protein
MNIKTRLPLPALLTLTAAGCGDSPPSVDPVCNGKVDIVVLQGNTDNVVRSDLLVSGTATHSSNLAIRNMTVGGVAANKDRFNFDAWSATVPFRTLQSLVPDPGGTVTVPVVATDACSAEFSTSFPVKLDLPLEKLTLTRAYPDGEGYVPASGKFPASLTITANAQAAGAKVTLSASEGGTFDGALDGLVTLSGDGTTDATATAFFTSTKPGTAFVTASAGDNHTAPIDIVVAGPPSMFPSSQTLAPKQSIRVTVDTDGRVESCQATPVLGITVKSGGKDLMATPAASDDNNDGKVDIDITAADMLSGAVTVTVACRDPFGQAVSGTYTAMP